MENNEENVNVEQTNTTPSGSDKKTFNFIPVVAILAVIAIVVAILFGVFTKSPKSVVKDFVKALEKGDAKKIMATIDVEGAAAYAQCGKDLEDFDEKYEDIMEQIKDMDDDEKKAYDKVKERMEDSFEDVADSMKDEDVKLKVKSVKVEKIDGSKKLQKVKAKIEMKADGEKDTQTITFYTMKKGAKNYIVYSEMM